MNKSFVIKGNICQTMNPKELDVHKNTFAICVDEVSKGALSKNITAKFVAGRQII